MSHQPNTPSPQTGSQPSPEIYGIMGEENIFKMAADFYEELEKSSLRPMFPEDMPTASQKFAYFLVGILGGPLLYHQYYGQPMMRARHLPFRIDEAARQEWLNCFNRVLDQAVEQYNFPTEHLPSFRNFLTHFSAWMVNVS